MANLDSRVSVLLLAPATVPVAPLHAGTADSAQTTDHTVDTRAVPERPDSLDESNVAEYAASYEEVRKHNQLLNETNATTPVETTTAAGTETPDG